jgi:hypothetical protein
MERVATQYGVAASRTNSTESRKFALCDIYFHHLLMHDVEEMNLCLLGLLGDLVTTLFFT